LLLLIRRYRAGFSRHHEFIIPDLVIGNGDSGLFHYFRRSALENNPAPTLVRVE